MDRCSLRPLVCCLALLAPMLPRSYARAQSTTVRSRSAHSAEHTGATRSVTPAIMKRRVHLVPPVEMSRPHGSDEGRGAGTTSTVIEYWLRSPEDTLTIEILDPRGSLVRRFVSASDSAGVDSPPRQAGLNRFIWDLRAAPASGFEGLVFSGASLAGPVVPPGVYQIRLLVGADSARAKFTLRPDSRAMATPRDYVEQYTLLNRLRARVSEANEAVARIRGLRSQLDERRTRIPDAHRMRYEVLATTLANRVGAIEKKLYQGRDSSNGDSVDPPKLLNNTFAALGGAIGSSPEIRPSSPHYSAFTQLSMSLDLQILALQRALREFLPRVNSVLREAQLEEVQWGEPSGSRFTLAGRNPR